MLILVVNFLAVNILAVNRPLSLYVVSKKVSSAPCTVSKSVVYTLSVLFRGRSSRPGTGRPRSCW